MDRDTRYAREGIAAERGDAPGLSGRYVHDAEWVDSVLRAAGFGLVVIDEVSVRSEARHPVPGLVVVARSAR